MNGCNIVSILKRSTAAINDNNASFKCFPCIMWQPLMLQILNENDCNLTNKIEKDELILLFVCACVFRFVVMNV